MTDKEPTREQIKEFWEWCGFPDNLPKRNFLPDIDLNNLFKYAVSKLEFYMLDNEPRADGIPCHGVAQFQGNRIQQWARTPALALFWAIYEIVKSPPIKDADKEAKMLRGELYCEECGQYESECRCPEPNRQDNKIKE